MVFVIGDVHGAHKALLQCFERSGFNYETDTLISLGDIADGWSEVPECVDELLKIKNLIPIRGNHDVWCWNWFTNGEHPVAWLMQGGQATMDAYIRTGELMSRKHIDFWNNQIDYYIDGSNRLFVHAGFDLPDGFEKSKTNKTNIQNATSLHWTRDLADLSKHSISLFERELLYEFNEIFIGHTAHNNNYFNKYNIWNIDTGAGWKGVLTIMNVDTKEFFQSDNVLLLYKHERGRF